MKPLEANKLKRTKNRMKEYVWKNLKKWKAQEEKVVFRIVSREKPKKEKH